MSEILKETNNDLCINLALTGVIPTKVMTPHVPVSVSEIIEDIHECWEIGITMVHVHARDPLTGVPTYRSEIYSDIITGVRKFAPELVICVSLSGRSFNSFEQRSEPLLLEGYAKPDMGSLTLSSLNFNNQASINEPEMIKALAEMMKTKRIAPELEAFDAGMINYAHYLAKKNLITPPFYFNLLLGNIACAQPDLLHAGIMIRDLPPNSYWSMTGIGQFQFKMNAIAIAMGGGVRVGLEDNIWFDSGRTKLARNADLLRRVHKFAEDCERSLMKSAELRRKLSLASGINGQYGNHA